MTSTSQPQALVCMPATALGLSAEAQTSEVRARESTWVGCHEDSLTGLVLHSWGSPGKSLDLPERQEILCAGTSNSVRSDSRTPPLWVPSQVGRAAAAVSSPRGADAGYSLCLFECRRWGRLWLQPLNPEAGATAARAAGQAAGRNTSLPHPPGSLCNLALPSDPRPGVNSPGRAQDRFRLYQSPTGPCHCRNSLHVITVSAKSFPLPNLTKQASHAQALPYTPPVWAKNRLWRAAYKQTWGQNQNWAPKAVSPKKRKEIWVVD